MAYTIDKIVDLLNLEDFGEVYLEADRVRKENVGDIVHIRALLEFSNYCKRRCKYCGLNCTNKSVKRYRMSPEEIISATYEAAVNGYKTIVLQSGEDNYFTPKILGEIVKSIKKFNMDITLCCGEMDYDSYECLKECGADRYLLKHETAQNELYEYLHPCGTLQERIQCLKNIKKLGYETGGGFMVGLPNQTAKTIAMDLMLLKEIGCDMAGIGTFIPHPNTLLRDRGHGSTEMTKRAVALTRIIMPKINLPATTSLGVINDKEKVDIFSCGANVIMQKVTPNEYKALYEIYPSNLAETNIRLQRIKLENQIKELNRIPL